MKLAAGSFFYLSQSRQDAKLAEIFRQSFKFRLLKYHESSIVYLADTSVLKT